MRTFTISILAGLCLVFTACEDPATRVPREEYDQLMEEYRDLRAGAEAPREEYAAQAAAIDGILQQLAQISGKTVSLRSELESGHAQITQVRQIEESIDQIKVKLGKLDALTAQHAQLKKLVGSLKTVIAEKEREIAELKAEIQAKDFTINRQQDTIAAQSGTIRSQIRTISAQQEDLRLSLQQLSSMLFQAGEDFEQLGDDAPQVSRRRDKIRVQEFRASMYHKAILYYRKAAETGYPESTYRISRVEEKLND